MGVKGLTRLGDWVERKTIRATNRSGATIVRGDLLALDLTGDDADVDTFATYIADTTPDPKASPLANVIAVGAAHDDGWPVVVCLSDSLADNAEGVFIGCGLAQVEIVGGNGTAATVVNGARLTPTSAQTYASGEVDGQSIIGILLEDGPTAATAAKKWVLFDGIKSSFGPQAEV